MAERFEPSEDDAITEILRRAIHKDASTGSDLQRRLIEAADELGISREAVAAAASEYQLEAAKNRELTVYQNEIKNAFRIHAVAYVLANLFCIGLNAMTLDKDGWWFPYVIFGWGIGLGIHAYIAHRKPTWEDEEFQKWRLERAAKGLPI